MVELKDVSKVFHPGSPNEIVALHDVSLHIKKRDFLVVVGSNGSGKSTLLNIVAGSLQNSAGIISIDGNHVTRMPEFKRSKWVARVFQDPLQGTAEGLTILENFRLAALRSSTKRLSIGLTKNFTEEVKDKVSILGLGLENKLHQTMATLSGGQRQALSLLMSIMADLKVLLLDEPTAALDPRSADIVLKVTDRIIREYDITAVMVTHNMKEAYQYGNRLVVMKDGRIDRDISNEEKRNLEITDLYRWFG